MLGMASRRRRKQHVHLLLVFLFCLLGSTYGATRAQLAIHLDLEPPKIFDAKMLDFGNVFRSKKFFYHANLMTPPDDRFLCDFPGSLFDDISSINKTSTKGFRAKSDTLALLISIGECSIVQKVRVALKIQRKITPTLKYLFFYNNDPNDLFSIPIFKPSENDLDLDESNDMGLVSVNTKDGAEILFLMDKRANFTNTTPELLSPRNEDWELRTTFERIGNVDDNHYNRTQRHHTPESFFWFKFVLFALLMVSPCCRTCYLWWAGGGRIHLRRNQQGRIVGLQYIPPMQYWFATTGTREPGPPLIDRLTEEQVLALPEIEYQLPRCDDEDNQSYAHDEVDENTLEDANMIVSSGSADLSEYPAREQEDEDSQKLCLSSPPSGDDEDEEQPVALPSDIVTSCVTCSICFEDFESGELVRVLPRCKHAFHTSCIMPWLTERQGCCPLCKTAVLESEEPEEAGDGAGDETIATAETLEQEEISNRVVSTDLVEPLEPDTSSGYINESSGTSESLDRRSPTVDDDSSSGVQISLDSELVAPSPAKDRKRVNSNVSDREEISDATSAQNATPSGGLVQSTMSDEQS